jgi:chitodextrinase
MCKIGRLTAVSLKLLIFFTFVLFCAIELPSLGLATTYYVATNGNDSYNGLYPAYTSSSNGPFRTINRAANTVKAGDTVQIRAGTYQEASRWSTNGNEANPITITNYEGETVIIDGSVHTIPGSIWGPLFYITGSWVTASNLEIRYSSGYGLMVADGAWHCTVDNIYAHHNWAGGISFSGWYGLANNCRAYNNSLMNENFIWSSAGWSTGISACRYAQHTTIRGCTSWDNWGEGISTFETYYITIEDCVSYNNQGNFYISDTQHTLVQRNLSYYTPGNMIESYCSQSCFGIGDETFVPTSSDNTFINNLAMGGKRNLAAEGAALTNCLIANNTFVNASAVIGDYNILFYVGTCSNARFANNIILQEDSVSIGYNGATGITFNHNDWSRSPEKGCQGAGDITGYPMLAKTGPTDPGSLTPAWFRTLESAPTRDRAKVLSEVIEDFFKTPRGSAPDMGAFEFSDRTSSLMDSATANVPLVPLSANIAASPTSGRAPLSVNFAGSASGGTSPYSYRWTFGDGGSSTSQNLSHTYSSAGSYTVTLTVSDGSSAKASATVSLRVRIVKPAQKIIRQKKLYR